jgi:curved DNA-binding protein CbpA
VNPYDLLGLAPDASDDAIRKAYRRAAKAVHPDVGGDPEAWALLQRAYDVLLDPDLRSRFDQTGEVGATIADNEHAEVTGFIAAAMQALFERIEAECIPAERVDMIRALKQQIGRDTQCRQKQIASMERMAKAMKGRFSVRDRQAEPTNRMEGLVRTLEANVGAALDRGKRLDALAERALVVLECYEFRQDLCLPPQPRMQPAMGQGGWSIWSQR